MVSTSAGAAYDKSPGDRNTADDSGRFEPIKLEVTVFKGKVAVKVINSKLASAQDSVLAITIEKAINELFVFERKKPEPKTPDSKQLKDGKSIDI